MDTARIMELVQGIKETDQLIAAMNVLGNRFNSSDHEPLSRLLEALLSERCGSKCHAKAHEKPVASGPDLVDPTTRKRDVKRQKAPQEKKAVEPQVHPASQPDAIGDDPVAI